MNEQPTPQKRRSRWPTIAPPAPRHRTPWTAEEDRLLRRYFGKKGSKHLARLLGRTRYAIQEHARLLGVPGDETHRWRQAEIRYITNRYKDRTAVQLARTLNRSVLSVRHQVFKMGLTAHRNRPWSQADDTYVRQHFRTETVPRIASALGRSTSSVAFRTQHLGLRRHIVKLTKRDVRYILECAGTVPYRTLEEKFGIDARRIHRLMARREDPSRSRGRPWSADDDARLRASYATVTADELAKQLSRTPDAVSGRAQVLGLRKRKSGGQSQTDTSREGHRS